MKLEPEHNQQLRVQLRECGKKRFCCCLPLSLCRPTTRPWTSEALHKVVEGNPLPEL